MNRRVPQPDGTVLVESDRRVWLYGRRGEVLEVRDLTDSEQVAHAAWEAGQADRPVAATVSEPDPGTYRSAVTGEFVTAQYAAEHPDTTLEVDLETVQALRARVAELEAQLEQA